MDMNLYSKRPKVKRIAKGILLWILELAIVVLAAYLIIEYAVEKTTMSGDSMNTTLAAHDEIIINKLAYLRKNPERFDVIVFKQSGREHGYYNIKRVIGLPGDTVEIAGGYVYINGERLNEVISVEPMRLAGIAQTTVILDEDEYFVLGDNRNSSEDSRFVNIGLVVREDIVGKAWFRLSPFSIIDKINRTDKD